MQQAQVNSKIKIMQGNRGTLILAILFSVFAGLATFVPYVMVFKTILFIFESNNDYSLVFNYGVISVISIVIKFIFQGLSMALTHIGAYNVLYEVRKKLCNHIGKLNMGFFTEQSSGELKKILIEDVERIENLLAHLIPDLIVAIVVPITVFIYLLTVHVPMTLFLLVPIVLNILAQVVMGIIGWGKLKQFNQAEGRLNSIIMQFINGMAVMKVYNLTTASYTELSDSVYAYNSIWKDLSKCSAPPSAIAKVISESAILWTLPIGGFFYCMGSLEISSYIFFMIMSSVFLSSFTKLYNFSQSISQISAGITRIKEILAIPAQKSTDKKLLIKEACDLEFLNVSFSYNEKEVLKNINLKLPKGSITAFVGASGAGKSTLATLVPRFWDITKGAICINGTDIKDIENDNLMDLISFVFQDAFMLDETIYQNVAIGNPNCKKEDVIRATKLAQIHDFIVSLPQGYETELGSAGVKMSGGEKQRICIARAILKNAPIVIFDEATSYTDIKNEHKIQLALNHLLKGKTTIMIAHRLHTIINATQICVFQDGEIKEIGTHEALLEQNGLYTNMWKTYIENGGEKS